MKGLGKMIKRLGVLTFSRTDKNTFISMVMMES